MATEYKPIGKYDTAGQGYDESLYDNAALMDGIGLSIGDGYIGSAEIAKAETLTIVDGELWKIWIDDVINIADSVIRNVTTGLNETFSMTDSIMNSANKGLGESINLVDSLTKAVTWTHNESLEILDIIVRSASLAKSEAVALADTLCFRLRFSETIQAVDSITKTAMRNLVISLGIADSYQKSINWIEGIKTALGWTEETKNIITWIEETKI